MNYLTAKDVMNPNVISVPADWTIEELSQFLIDKAITGAPVKDENGKLIGVVSLTDIVRHDSLSEVDLRADEPHDYYMHGWEDRLAPEDLTSFHVEDKSQAFVRDIMTPMLFKVDENTSIQEVADTMIGGRVHRLLVTHEGKVIGIVTTMDMLKAIRDMEDVTTQK
ncbi:MAG: CBS domain-containing protein [bacterium]